MGIVRQSLQRRTLTVHTLCNGLYKQNCYIVANAEKKECIVIDPGGEPDFLTENIVALGFRVVHILLTHGHFDHLGACNALTKIFDLPCLVHAADKKLVRQAGTYAFRFARQKLMPLMHTSYFEKCDAFAWSGGNIRTIHTPGHTAGSVSYFFQDDSIFSGDTLFLEHIGPDYYPESDSAALFASINLILSILPEDGMIFSGHGKPWQARDAKLWWQNYSANPPRFQLFGAK